MSCGCGGNIMFYAFRVAMIAAVVWLTGCAIHPLPEDVTGVSTYNIVRQIRCEARQAIFDFAITYLTSQNDDLEAKRVGQEFKEGLRPIHSFSYKLFKGEIGKL